MQRKTTTRVFKSNRLLIGILVLLPMLLGCQHLGGPFGDARNEAELAFEAGADRDPTPGTLYALAGILATQGKDEPCRLVLLRLIRRHPRFMPAYCDLAELQLRRGAVDQAMVTLTAGLAADPRDQVLRNNLGMCWLLKGDSGKALEQFTQAAGDAPNDVRYRSNMAVALGMLDRDEESLALFKQVLSETDAEHNLQVLGGARSQGARAAEPSEQAEAPDPAREGV